MSATRHQTVEGSLPLGNTGDLLVAVRQLSGDLLSALARCASRITHGQAALTTDGHTNETLVPTTDDLAAAEDKLERRPGSVGVKLLAILEFTNVSHTELLAGLGTGSFTELDIFDHEAGRECALVVSVSNQREGRGRVASER